MATQTQTSSGTESNSSLLSSSTSPKMEDTEYISFSPNFAYYEPRSASAKCHEWKRVPMQYDHEIYLQLTAGEDGTIEKTANQVYLEERERLLQSRSQDPAVYDPQQDAPSPIDFECAERQRIKAIEYRRGMQKPVLRIRTSPTMESRSRSMSETSETSMGVRMKATMSAEEDWVSGI
ncbi:hypothetical protein PAAG_07025 [Paracoccidioides lutzii Pb01]|uniref:Uncharacterized protein n=1 Tax=Paracoccidioides lutzii (strain ATCC MYA-826 / Pb01) TaxID=502779 RepID=C1H848_PARBA|nr:hypothetical protein PAAG_07025 [Paracoccidioides lutzii Pb01]EEH36607.1 hypothetical protein PAAG_07025 [Paracoccidioides lutzii Pb01]